MRLLGSALAILLAGVTLLIILRSITPLRTNQPIPPPPAQAAPAQQHPARASQLQKNPRGDSLPLADDVLSAVDRYFANVNIMRCADGWQPPIADFDVAMGRFSRNLPDDASETLKAFKMEATYAVVKMKVLCGWAALGKIQESNVSVEEIYQHKEKAVDLYRTLRSTPTP